MHAHWIPAAVLTVKAISCLISGPAAKRHISILLDTGCSSALVQAVCVHYLGTNVQNNVPSNVYNNIPNNVPNNTNNVPNNKVEVPSSLLLLEDLLRCIGGFLAATHTTFDDLSQCRSSLIREGAHEAMVLVLRTHTISNDYSCPIIKG